MDSRARDALTRLAATLRTRHFNRIHEATQRPEDNDNTNRKAQK